MSIPSAISGRLAALSVRKKLLGAFLILLSITVLMTAFSILQFSRVNQVSNDLAHRWMPSIGYTTTIRTLMLEVRDLEVKHTRAADVGYMEEYEEKITAAVATITKDAASYEAMLDTADSKSLFAAFTKSWADYQTVTQKVIALDRAKKQDEGKDISDGAGKSASDDAIMALDKLTAFNFSGGEQAADEADAIFQRVRMLTLGLLAGAVLIGLLLALSITSSLLRQLGSEPQYATALTSAIAEGKLYMDIPLRAGDTTSLLSAIREMRNSIAKIVKEVRSRSDDIATASSEIQQGTDDLSGRTEQQAISLQQTAASMDQLKETVRQNADDARQASDLARGASDVAVRGGEVVGQVVGTMKDINDSSKKIADIIGIINGIAFQTNILALNAAVEAARAGEQGRGFAVVAAEVRNLAGRSAEAAKEINSLVSASLERVAQGAALVDQAGSTMTEVVGSIRKVTELMGAISQASDAQSGEVERVGMSISEMDEATQQNSALVEEMAAATANLANQAQELVQAASIFILNEADART